MPLFSDLSIGGGMAIEEFGRHVIDFVREHEAWAAPIVFSLAFAESLAFLSFVVPAWAVLVGIGAMMRSGGIAFIPVFLAGALGLRSATGCRTGSVGSASSGSLGDVAVLGTSHPARSRRSLHQEVARSRSSSAVSPGRCAPRCRSRPACSGCRCGRFRWRISPPHWSGWRCCWCPVTSPASSGGGCERWWEGSGRDVAGTGAGV